MTLEDAVRTMAKRWPWIILPAILGTLLGSVFGLTRPAAYQASAQVLFTVDAGTSATDLNQASNYLERQMTSYSGVVTTPLVLGPVVEELKLDQTPQDLSEDVSASFETGSALMSITVTRESPDEAALIANGVAKHMVTKTDELSPAPAKLPRTVKATQLTQALPPTVPSGLPWLAMAFAGGFVGLLLGLGLAFAAQDLDRRVRSLTDLRRASRLTALGVVRKSPEPFEGQALPEPLREDIRSLRAATGLLDGTTNDGDASTLVTALHDGNGASTVALGLALSLAEAGRRVLLVDADVQSASLTQRLGKQSSTTGLIEALDRPEAAQALVQPVGERLDLLPASAGAGQAERLDAGNVRSAIAAIAAPYDEVVIDSAALLEHPDARLLAPACTSCIVVAAADSARSPELQRAEELLGNRKNVGVVLNRARRQG